MNSHRSLLLVLILLFGLFACQTGQQPVTTTTGESGIPEPDLDADASVLTPTEEDIIRAFQFEVNEEWLDAALVYDKLARSSV